MTRGEVIIAILLITIAYLLFHIAKQLSYLTGKKLKMTPIINVRFKPVFKTKKHERLPEKLPN